LFLLDALIQIYVSLAFPLPLQAAEDLLPDAFFHIQWPVTRHSADMNMAATTEQVSIIGPARVKVICVPIGTIKQSRFVGFVERLAKENVVRLGDVSPDNRPHRTMFSPLAFAEGRILLDITTSFPPAAHLALAPFEIYRKPLVIVAVADGKESRESSPSHGQLAEGTETASSRDYLPDGDIQFLLEQRQKLESDFSIALVHQVLIFDSNIGQHRLPEGLLVVPTLSQSKSTTMKTVTADLASRLLAQMASLARSLQESTSIETPRVPRQNIQRPLAKYADPSQSAIGPSDPHRSDHRMSMPAHLLENAGSRPSTPTGRPTSPPNGIRSSPASPPSRPADGPRAMSRDRASMQGFGSNSLAERERNKSRGRTHVVLGSLYLLAGRWPDAVKELTEGATAAKVNSDHNWHAKALDYLLITCLFFAWAGLDFQVPRLFYDATERVIPGSTKSAKETPSASNAELTTRPTGASIELALESLSRILPELLTVIQNLYSRSWTFSDDRIPQLSFSETGLRFSKLLMMTSRAGGDLKSTHLEGIVMKTSVKADSLLKKPLSSPTKAELVAFLFRSFPSTETDASLTIADRMSLFAGMTAILTDLGARHERAHILKEMVASMVPALVEARKRGAAEMGIHPAASLASLDAALISARRTQALSAFGEDEAGVHNFLSTVCRAYCVDTRLGENNQYHTQGDDETPKNGEDPKHLSPVETISQRVVQHASSKIAAFSELKIDVLRLCINVCEALPDLEGVLHFSVELLRASGSGIAPGPDDSDGASSLSIEDQLRLWNNISRTVGVARQLGLKNLEAEYWDDFLLRGINVMPSASNRPASHEKRELDLVDEGKVDVKQGPFLYNPFGQSNQNQTEKPLLVAGEQAVFKVTLQNLYDFDLEIESIRLTPDDTSCTTEPQAVIVGPYRTQSCYLTAEPGRDGTLTINGCMAKIRGCRERWFPLFDAPWSFKANAKSLQTQQTRPSDAPLPGDQEDLVKTRLKAPSGPIASSLVLDVILALPHLTLKSMTLSQGAVMLLEGETKRLEMTLHNASKTVKADLVLPTFEDSTAAGLQAAMDNKERTPSDLHELQLATLKKPLRWSKTEDDPEVTIEPGEDYALDIEITGKPGLCDATILVSYGHLGVPRNEIKDRFYTRQLSMTLAITVNASIDITRTDILPFSSNFAWQNQQRPPSRSSPSAKSPTETRRPPSMSLRSKSNKLAINSENRFHSLLSRIGLGSNDEKAHCLVCLDCRNSWPTPLSVSIQVLAPPSFHDTTIPTNTLPHSASPNDDNNPSPPKIAYTVHESLQPGHTKRILLLLPRLRFARFDPPPVLKRQDPGVLLTICCGNAEASLEKAHLVVFAHP
ncbi:MAG: hypothetical protein Q9174_004779, partial [Haloplaca sp. 1 TL-2023]